ncbi:hypothetical protein COBT_003270, partial [Conglomerata obtusa]
MQITEKYLDKYLMWIVMDYLEEKVLCDYTLGEIQIKNICRDMISGITYFRNISNLNLKFNAFSIVGTRKKSKSKLEHYGLILDFLDDLIQQNRICVNVLNNIHIYDLESNDYVKFYLTSYKEIELYIQKNRKTLDAHIKYLRYVKNESDFTIPKFDLGMLIRKDFRFYGDKNNFFLRI